MIRVLAFTWLLAVSVGIVTAIGYSAATSPLWLLTVFLIVLAGAVILQISACAFAVLVDRRRNSQGDVT